MRATVGRWLMLPLILACVLRSSRVRADESIQVTVLAILASDQKKEVDPKLKPIAEKVQKIEPELTGFRLSRSACKGLIVGKPHKFTFVEEQSVTVTVDHGADKKNRVGLTVKPPQLGAISYTSCCGKFFPIITRYQTKDKERLIIAIMVETCADEE